MPSTIVTPRNLPGVKIGDSHISASDTLTIYHPHAMLMHSFYIDSPECTFGRLFSIHETDTSKVIAAFTKHLLKDDFGPLLTAWITKHRNELETAYNELCPAN